MTSQDYKTLCSEDHAYALCDFVKNGLLKEKFSAIAKAIQTDNLDNCKINDKNIYRGDDLEKNCQTNYAMNKKLKTGKDEYCTPLKSIDDSLV